MKEIYHLQQAKQIMSKFNVIIYGTIRDIEPDFLNSFSNLELLSHYFDNVYIIILENDSKDNTRNLLMEWYKCNNSNKLKKHIILINDLDEKYPLRATRLAYCRNLILNYIFDNQINNHYQYAIHCDLDDRLWSINFDSLCNCFQYDLKDWDMMSGVNQNNDYYDWWALRCENTWFNKNIFSCETNGIHYECKIFEFHKYLNENKIFTVNSAFNGLGIYKLTSLKNCNYSANYYCNKCDNKNRGCMEDNDHIGLHKQMIQNSCKLFINTNIIISYKPKDVKTYNDFILDIQRVIQCTQFNKQPLYYLLNNQIIKEGNWVSFGIKDGENINQISKYTDKNIFCFDEFENPPFKNEKDIHTFHQFNQEIKIFLNKNVKIIPGYYFESIPDFKRRYLKKNMISFISIISQNYQATKQILNNLVNIINKDCIIYFNEFMNYPDYHLYEIKAFYEFVEEFKIKYEIVCASDELHIKIKNNSSKNNKSIVIRIIENPLLNNNHHFNLIKEDFDWIYYINNYEDLKHIQSKELAWHHWIHHGSKEGRTYKNQSIKKPDTINEYNFDWIFYINHYEDLKHIQTKEEAWEHWTHYGSHEGRICKKSKNTKNDKKEQEDEMNQKEIEEEQEELEEDELNEYEKFDWEYYLMKYHDLSSIKTKEEAWNHWIHYGSKEGRSYDTFDWFLYLQLNPDLGENGINNRESAIHHWKHYGKKEGRKYIK